MRAKFVVTYGAETDPGVELGRAEFPYSVAEFEADMADYALNRGTPRFTNVKLDAWRYWSDKALAAERYSVDMRLVWL